MGLEVGDQIVEVPAVIFEEDPQPLPQPILVEPEPTEEVEPVEPLQTTTSIRGNTKR